jgi:hypothetical protein
MNATATIAPAPVSTSASSAPADRASACPSKMSPNGVRPSGASGPRVSGPQYMRALQRANKVRLARAELKRGVATGKIEVTDVLLDCPWEAESMAIADLLVSQRRWGQNRARKFLSQIPISETKTIGSMTDRQRQTLVALLRGASIYSLRDLHSACHDSWLAL